MNTAKIFEFKIALRGTKPRIWRRIQVPEEYNFWDLHVAIQDAMGWKDCHLHQFEIINPKTGQKDRIGIPDPGGDSDTISGKKAKMAQYFLAPKDKACYEYDFGDGWMHEIVLEKILPAVLDSQYPQCIAGKQACPPEDCGGVWGYKEHLEIVANPDHDKYAEHMEWLGGSCDPAAFDPKSVVFRGGNGN